MADPPRLPVLFSYPYLSLVSVAEVETALEPDYFDVLIDSGAFTAFNAGWTISLPDYVGFLKHYGEGLTGYFALDVVQDPTGTDRNLAAMLDQGLRPIPVHVFGDTEEKLDALFEVADVVALAGLRRPHRGHAPESYVALKNGWAAGRPVHWLGYARQKMLERFRPYSCDAATWKGGYKYGRIHIYLGRGIWSRAINFTTARKALRDASIRNALVRHNVDLAEWLDPDHWRARKAEGTHHKYTRHETILQRLSTQSWIEFVMDFRERFGTRIYLAAKPGEDVEDLKAGWEWWKNLS